MSHLGKTRAERIIACYIMKRLIVLENSDSKDDHRYYEVNINVYEVNINVHV